MKATTVTTDRAIASPRIRHVPAMPAQDSRGRFVAGARSEAPSWYVFSADAYRIPGEAPQLPSLPTPSRAPAVPAASRTKIARRGHSRDLLHSGLLVVLILVVSGCYAVHLFVGGYTVGPAWFCWRPDQAVRRCSRRPDVPVTSACSSAHARWRLPTPGCRATLHHSCVGSDRRMERPSRLRRPLGPRSCSCEISCWRCGLMSPDMSPWWGSQMTLELRMPGGGCHLSLTCTVHHLGARLAGRDGERSCSAALYREACAPQQSS